MTITLEAIGKAFCSYPIISGLYKNMITYISRIVYPYH